MEIIYPFLKYLEKQEWRSLGSWSINSWVKHDRVRGTVIFTKSSCVLRRSMAPDPKFTLQS